MTHTINKTPPRSPSTGPSFAVPDSISGDAEFWRVIRSIQALRSNEGSTAADVHFLLAELVDEVAESIWLAAPDENSLERITVAILTMIGEADQACLYVKDREKYQRLYEEGERRFYPQGSGTRMPIDPLLQIRIDPTNSDTKIHAAVLMEARRRRVCGVILPAAAFYAIGLMVLRMATDRLREKTGIDPVGMGDEESQRAVAPIAAQVAEEFGECEMAELMVADWPEFMVRYADAKTVYDAVEPQLVVQ